MLQCVAVYLVLAPALALQVQKMEAIPPRKGEPLRPSVAGREAVTTASGLKYWDLRQGRGPLPKPESRIVVHYTGWLSDGSIYTTTARQEGPSTVRLGRSLIAGLTEGILNMRVGGQRRLEVPPSLAYGKNGFFGRVPPNETLTFLVELVDVQQPPEPPRVSHLRPTSRRSGLVYWDLKKGKGDSPTPGAVVTIKFSRWREDGKLIDTTYFDDKSATFLLTQVTKGWAEGIRSMRVGGRRFMKIPPELAFGAAGLPPYVGPNETITSEIELLDTRSLNGVKSNKATVRPIKTNR